MDPMFKDRVKQRKWQREKWAKTRREWIEANGPCRNCGSSLDLEVDHVDPSTKITHNVWSWALSRRLAELAKCQVLCKKCHLIKTSKDRIDSMKHGTERMYRNFKCRCLDCKEWKRKKSADEYLRRKNQVLGR